MTMQPVFLGPNMQAVARPSMQFGRQINRSELMLLAGKVPLDNLKPDLSFAYDMSLTEFENFAGQGTMKVIKNGKEIVEDSIRLMNHLRQNGLPSQDQPVYLVLKGQFPSDLPERPIDVDLVQTLRVAVPGPVKFVLKGIGLNVDTLPASLPPAQGYSRRETRQAMQELVDSKDTRPINEMMVLMNMLINRTRPEDLIKLDNGRFAFRMILPGADASA